MQVAAELFIKIKIKCIFNGIVLKFRCYTQQMKKVFFNNLNKILVSSYVIFLILLSVHIFKIGWSNTWTKFAIPSMYPYFADLRTIQGAILSRELGLNPQLVNPGDPWDRSMNYPIIWLQIAKILHLENQASFLLFGIFIIALFVLANLFILYNFPSLIIFLSLISGSTLLGMERANNDLLIYFLLTMGVFFKKTLIAFFTLSFILKIYPIGAIYILIRNKNNFFIYLILILILLFSIYPQLQAISKGNSAGGLLSYGFPSISLWAPNYIDHKLFFFYLICFTIITAFFHNRIRPLISNKSRSQLDSKKNILSIDLFVVGSSIYVATYIFANNWDYRLIFIILCLPYLSKIRNHFFSKLLPIIIIVIMNLLLISKYINVDLTFINLAFKFLIFNFLYFILWHMIIEQFKNFITNLSLKKVW